jgi:hypothetical protein
LSPYLLNIFTDGITEYMGKDDLKAPTTGIRKFWDCHLQLENIAENKTCNVTCIKLKY